MSVTAAFLILKKRLVEEEEKETSFRIDEWSVRTKGKIQFDSISFRFTLFVTFLSKLIRSLIYKSRIKDQSMEDELFYGTNWTF